MTANTPQSRKAKGRNLQKWVRDELYKCFPHLAPDDVTSRSMGSNGEDLILATPAAKVFPYSIECKNVEKLNIWEAYTQAKANCKKEQIVPLVVFKKNHHRPLVAVDAEYFIWLHKELTKGEVP